MARGDLRETTTDDCSGLYYVESPAQSHDSNFAVTHANIDTH